MAMAGERSKRWADVLDRFPENTIEYHGHKLRATPPGNPIAMRAAARKYHVSLERVWEAIDAGELLAGLEKAPSGNTRVVVCRYRANQIFGTDGESGAPADGVPIKQLARDLTKHLESLLGKKGARVVHPNRLLAWCDWDPHPALGRKIWSGDGTYTITESSGKTRQGRGILISLADATLCVEIVAKPTNRPIPGNPGEWRAEGIFQHQGGGLFYTERYVHEHPEKFKFSENALFNPAYFDQFEKTEILKVVWPGKRGSDRNGGAEDRWKVTVFSAVAIERLNKGGDDSGDGRWTVDGEIWLNKRGRWYSTKYIAREGDKSNEQIRRLRLSGILSDVIDVTLGKEPDGTKPGVKADSFKRPGKVSVYHESQVDPLLGVGSGAESRGRRELEKHKTWKKWFAGGKRAGGMSHEDVASRWNGNHPDEICTAAAVKMAIKRLK
jgi:hypothetical protein